MARDYGRVHEFYLQLHELQPPALHYHPYRLPHTSTSPAQVYEMTAAAGAGAGGACGEPAGALLASHPPLPLHAAHHAPHTPHIRHHDPRKRKNSHYSEYDSSNCEAPLAAPPATQPTPATSPGSATRKRKTSMYSSCGMSAYEDDAGDGSRSMRSAPEKKQNHSEIEKRRRDKMNTYITELSAMIPMCGAMSRKLDKLTVLRMAVQHLRSVRGSLSACPLSARPRPAIMTEKELNALVLRAAHDCFLLVVGCDRGRLLYVSASVTNMLHYDESELLGQSLFDILHPKDVAKVKEQLSSFDLTPRERLIDAKTMLPVKADVIAGASRLCPGARRSFFCRIKCKVPPGEAAPPAPAPASTPAPTPPPSTPTTSNAPTPLAVKEEAECMVKMRKKQQTEKKYCVVQFTGYLKSKAPSKMGEGEECGVEGSDDDTSSLTCLVAVGRALTNLTPPLPPAATPFPPPPTRHLQYVSRHATDGKFLFVDQRVTLALGFLPQELLDTSLYEYVEGPELAAVARTHKTALLQRDTLHTPPYSFRTKSGSFARIQTCFKPFKNPWTKEVECLVANNTLITDAEPARAACAHHQYDMFSQRQSPAAEGVRAAPSDVASALSEADVEMQRLIDSQVESHKIGSAIADEVFRRASPDYSPELPADLLQDAVFHNQQASLVDSILGGEMGAYAQVRNNVSLSAAGGAHSPPPPHDARHAAPPGTPPPASPPLPPLAIDGNGEAAMAVIMSLLEADAGLGGPINFSGLPWPLP